MHSISKKMLVVFVVATLAGACLHFVYAMIPNPVVALFSPINESLWEHLKILVWPYLIAILMLTRGGEAGCRTPWLMTLLILSALMLGFGVLYHVVFGGTRLAVDIGLYVILMAMGFLLPGLLHSVGDHPLVRDLTILAVILLFAAILLFTFLPPSMILFSDLSGVSSLGRIPY